MSAKILVVDDEPAIADTLVWILSDAGYDCKAAYGGEEALRRAVEFRPSVVIADVIMPGVNGVEMARRLRAFDPACTVLLVSGNAATQDLLEHARAQGETFEIMAKPVPPRTLLAKLAELVPQ